MIKAIIVFAILAISGLVVSYVIALCICSFICEVERKGEISKMSAYDRLAKLWLKDNPKEQ